MKGSQKRKVVEFKIRLVCTEHKAQLVEGYLRDALAKSLEALGSLSGGIDSVEVEVLDPGSEVGGSSDDLPRKKP